MPQMPESKMLARSIRRHARGSVRVNGHRIVKGRVAATDPLAIDLIANDVSIESEHLLLGTWARHFDQRFGISVGDTAMLSRTDDGDWYVQDVISQSDMQRGDAPDGYAASVHNTGSGHTVGFVPYLDGNGTEVGVLVLYDRATLRDFQGKDAVNNNAVVPT